MTELRLEGVTFAYPAGPPVLEDLDLVVPAGRTLALIGANGSGKTTLARHLDGLLRPTRGRVLVGGEDAAGGSVAQLARLVGLCFQQPERQVFAVNVRDEVEFGPRHLGLSDEEAFARAQAALAMVGLVDVLGHHPDDLGETRRKLLTIASVLALETPVLVLDEPTTGLTGRAWSASSTSSASSTPSAAASSPSATTCASWPRTFERVVLLDGGHVALDGTPEEVFAETAWPRLRAAGLEPPHAAVVGARLGLGSTPTDAAVVRALADRAGAGAPDSAS